MLIAEWRKDTRRRSNRMDPTLASVAGTAFAAGLAALYLALFRRLPPKIFGLKVFSFMGGGQSSTRETTSAERNLSRGERVFLGSIGVACWSVTGVILFIGVTRWDERRTPEDLTQPQHTDETTKNASDACPPIPPDKFLIGAYYRRLQSDPLRTQVVDQDDRDDLKHPDALWVGTDGWPILNPNRPLQPDIVEVVEAFGSVENVVMYNACSLQPDE